MPDLAPDAIHQQNFRKVLRGYDPSEVREFLQEVAEALAALASERDRLSAKLGVGGTEGLRHEIELVSREIQSVLEAARAAAEAMRERAAGEAARWRSEAVAEAERNRREAQADAEHLRSDAWATGESLLTAAQREADRLRTEAEKESMRLVGEAERESHRMVGAGRREAEETLRTAKMEAEKLVLDARTQHDAIIETATRQAEVAQERTKALEERRDELRRELESVRAALVSVEGELDERREALGLTPSQVVQPETDTEEDQWVLGETVRVVRHGQPDPRGGDEPVSSDPRVSPDPTPELRILSPEELRSLREPVQPDPETEPVGQAAEQEPEDSDDAPRESPPAEAVEPDEGPRPAGDDAGEVEAPPPPDASEEAEIPARIAEAEPVRSERVEEPHPSSLDEVEGLFARLREPAASEQDPDREQGHSPAHESVITADPFEIRDRLLLPISNRALRNLKRQLTEEQNGALEEIRLDESGWVPDPETLRASLRADLVVLAAESFAAGHAAAETLVDRRLTRPSTPKTDVAADFAAALADDIDRALEEGRRRGHGARQLGADISRVFRAWRTDESERRLREYSYAAYNRGVAETLDAVGRSDLRWVVAGRGCAVCRERAEHVPTDGTPPAHDGCGCTIVPA